MQTHPSFLKVRAIEIILSNGNTTSCRPIGHTSDNKIGRPCSGRPICLSRVWFQTELDDTKSVYQLIIKITISEWRKIAKLPDKGKIYIKKTDKGCINLGVCILFQPRLWLVGLNYNFKCYWLIGLLNCLIKNCPIKSFPITNCPTTGKWIGGK